MLRQPKQMEDGGREGDPSHQTDVRLDRMNTQESTCYCVSLLMHNLGAGTITFGSIFNYISI